jgi:hypothetical protein
VWRCHAEADRRGAECWFNTVLVRGRKTFLNSNGGGPFISTPQEGQALLLK